MKKNMENKMQDQSDVEKITEQWHKDYLLEHPYDSNRGYSVVDVINWLATKNLISRTTVVEKLSEMLVVTDKNLTVGEMIGNQKVLEAIGMICIL